ncbi:MAG: hypothetical protein V1734_00125 [Nanoarchaeota archaeon]
MDKTELFASKQQLMNRIKEGNASIARRYLATRDSDVAWVVLEAEDRGDGFEETNGDVLFYSPSGGLEPLTARFGRYDLSIRKDEIEPMTKMPCRQEITPLEQMLLKKGLRK